MPEISDITIQVTSVEATVTNGCDTPLTVTLSYVLFDGTGQPIAATRTERWTAEPGDQRKVSIITYAVGAVTARPYLNTAVNTELICMEVGASASRCLPVHPLLRGAVNTLLDLRSGRYLLQVATDRGLEAVRLGPLDERHGGEYYLSTRTIWLNDHVERESEWERAVALIHELHHAADHDDLVMVRHQDQCLGPEDAAVAAGLSTWTELWREQLPYPQTTGQRSLNYLFTVRDTFDPAYVRWLDSTYEPWCPKKGR